MKYSFIHIRRNENEIIQVMNGSQIVGSFNIPLDDIDFWTEVEQFIQDRQKEDEPTHTRIN